MANYWIKLYHEILDDPLMATMPDRLWRRTIELFLVCGRFSDDGCLPNSKQIAWILRADVATIENDLKEIASLGIITETESGWAVKNFKKRQAPSSSTERSKAFREKERTDQYYCNANATETQQNVAQITDTDNRSDTEREKEPPSHEPNDQLTPEWQLYAKACACFKASPDDFLTDPHKRLLRLIRTDHRVGADKFIRACENRARAPDVPGKIAVEFFLDDFKWQDKIIEWSKGVPQYGKFSDKKPGGVYTARDADKGDGAGWDHKIKHAGT